MAVDPTLIREHR